MIDQLKLFFEKHLLLESPAKLSEEQLKIASAVLFLEMMNIDNAAREPEQAMIASILQENFSLSGEQIRMLLDSAENSRQQATDYFQFTSLINKAYSLEQKIQLIESLWKIAFIDGVLDMHEEYLVRKIADLLYVPHADFIKAKNRVHEHHANNTRQH
ncbi:MAG: hypothetical protein CTY29_10570 [Methylobacter sp.]|nr:MAG: hypothetical protein CTY29_10570 [Methylobacter sp.]